MWLQRAPLARHLSLRRTLAVGPAFLPAESGPCWSDKGIHFLPEKVAAVEFRAGRSLPPCCPRTRAWAGLLMRQPLWLHVSVFSVKVSPATWALTRLQTHLCLGEGDIGLYITHGPRCLFHHPPLCHPVPARRCRTVRLCEP